MIEIEVIDTFFMEIHSKGLQETFITYSNLHDPCTFICKLNGNKSLPRIKCSDRISGYYWIYGDERS